VRSPPPTMPQQRSARTSDTVREARLRHEEGVGGRATLRATSATWTTALVVLRERGALGSTADARSGSRCDRTSVRSHSGSREAGVNIRQGSVLHHPATLSTAQRFTPGRLRSGEERCWAGSKAPACSPPSLTLRDIGPKDGSAVALGGQREYVLGALLTKTVTAPAHSTSTPRRPR
jgi:hypothetical protein